MFQSEFKGQTRLYITDLDSKEVKFLNFLDKKPEDYFQGDYEIMRIFEDTLVLKYSSYNTPPQIYSIIITNLAAPSLSELIKQENLQVNLIEEARFYND